MLAFRMLLVVLCLSVFTTSASAECAWVLWEDTTSSNKTTTEPVRAYVTKAECDRALRDVVAEFKPTPGQIVSRGRGEAYQEAFVTIGKHTTGYRYVCLPDTIDPRGPKGHAQ